MKIRIFFIFHWVCIIAFAQTPEYVILTPSGGWYQYSTSVSNNVFTASLTNVGNIWKLNIIAHDSIKSVLFPWESQRHPVDNNINDDIFYYPFIAGVTEKATNCNVNWAWKGGLVYPGQLFAPLVIAADVDNGRIVAAVNYPPKKVVPYYAAERIHFAYNDINLLPGDTISFSALIDSVSANLEQGEKAWMLALDKYRIWLDSVFPPVIIHPKVQNAHGWLMIGLMNYPKFNLAEISQLWTQWRDKLGWMYLIGQMSNYAGPPHLAVPPLLPGEAVGCCLLKQTMHDRYYPELVDFVRDSVIALGYIVNYYSAPFYGTDSFPRLFLDTQPGRDWLFSWINKNRNQYHANAFYLDVLGREYFGNPETVRLLFDGIQIPSVSVMEGIVDIYPIAGLISGGVVGVNIWKGSPDSLPENAVATTFPAFGRYLLNDRDVFLGQSNGEHIFWGPSANYWLERQAFLLGAKYDVSNPNDNYNPNTPNPALTLGISERNNVNWWQRKPRYLDTRGITYIPSGIEVRRFIDTAGCNLFTIDNWNQRTGQVFVFEGKSFNIPSQKLSILVDCTPTGVKNIENERKVKLSSNPFKSYVNIEISTPLKDAKLTIFNIFGQVVKQVKNISGQTCVLSLDNIPAGLYFFQLSEGNNIIETNKLIITY